MKKTSLNDAQSPMNFTYLPPNNFMFHLHLNSAAVSVGGDITSLKTGTNFQKW